MAWRGRQGGLLDRALLDAVSGCWGDDGAGGGMVGLPPVGEVT